MPSGACWGGLWPNHPTRIVEYSSSERANEPSLTLPVMPRSRRTPKGPTSARNQGPHNCRRRQAYAIASIRSAFHHQGLTRLGATPFRDAVTLCGRSLSQLREAVRPRARPSSAARSPRIITTRRPWFNPRARHASCSLTLRERGPHARRHLNGFCSSTFKDQRTSTSAGAGSRTPRAMKEVWPPKQQSQRDVRVTGRQAAEPIEPLQVRGIGGPTSVRVPARGRPRAGLGPNPLHSDTPCCSPVAPMLGVREQPARAMAAP